jgi:hypothetical protein
MRPEQIEGANPQIPAKRLPQEYPSQPGVEGAQPNPRVFSLAVSFKTCNSIKHECLGSTIPAEGYAF